MRQRAVEALKQIGGQPSIDALTAMLDNPGADLRREAITALGTMKARSAVPRLLPFVNQADMHDDAVSALTQIDDLAAFDINLDGLGSKNASLRTQCENALRLLKTPALPMIEARLSTNDLSAPALASLKLIYNGDPAAKKSPAFRHKIAQKLPSPVGNIRISRSPIRAMPGTARNCSTIFRGLGASAVIASKARAATSGRI